MKTKITITIILWGIGQLLFAQTYNTVTPSGHTISYTCDGTTAKITGCYIPPDNNSPLIIPSAVYLLDVNGQPYISPSSAARTVTSIGPWAFENRTSLTAIVLPDCITKISQEAFKGCTNLISIQMPMSLHEIWSGAFENCTSLESIEIRGDVEQIPEDCFRGCTNLSSVIMPNTVTAIGNNAFYNSGLTSVTLPSNILSIGYGAFCLCPNLTKITIPSSLDRIDNIFCGEGVNLQLYMMGVVPPLLIGQLPVNVIINVPSEALLYYQNAWSAYAQNITDTNWDNEVITNVNDSLMGAVFGGGFYSFGDTVTLYAVAKRNHAFTGWSNGVFDNPYSFVVSSDSIITAIFSTPLVVNNYYYDTIFITRSFHDSIIVNNYIYDTIYMNRYIFDTIWLHDTVYVTTQEIGNIIAINAKIYQSNGQIVVEGADGNRVTLYDVNGRVLATKQDDYTPLYFNTPVSGTYMIKIGAYPARKVVVIR